MGIGETLGKCVLVLVNSVFMVLGIIFFLFGIFLLAAESIISKANLLPFDLTKQFEALLNTTTNEIDTGVLAEQSTDEFFALFKDLGVVLLVFGLIMMVITIVGCCGSCCMVRCMLIFYVIVVSALLIVQAIAIGLFATGKLDKPVQDRLTDTLIDKYTGNFGLGIETLTMNMLQAWIGCCGINDWNDFNNATKWNRTEGFRVGNVTYYGQVAVPATCCYLDGDFPLDFTLEDEQCPIRPTDENSYINDGCYDVIVDELSGQKTIVLGVVGGSLALELICVLLGICLICAAREKDDGMY